MPGLGFDIGNKVAGAQAQANADAAAAAKQAAYYKALQDAQYITPASAQNPDVQLARQNTARSMELLRQGVNQGETSGIERLRRQLASRGLMDSGSLGAGTADIVNYGQGQMAQGALGVANNENQTILDLLKQQRERQFQQESQERSIAAQENIARLQEELQRQAQPPWWAGALSSAGQGLGAAAGKAIMGLF